MTQAQRVTKGSQGSFPIKPALPQLPSLWAPHRSFPQVLTPFQLLAALLGSKLRDTLPDGHIHHSELQKPPLTPNTRFDFLPRSENSPCLSSEV